MAQGNNYILAATAFFTCKCLSVDFLERRLHANFVVGVDTVCLFKTRLDKFGCTKMLCMILRPT